MASVSTYLNFMGQTEAAFEFYKAVFRSEYSAPLMRMGDVRVDDDGPQLAESDKQLVMHVALPILGGHLLMGTDLVESMGHQLVVGNNVSINLEPDSREEADRLYTALSEGDAQATGMAEMFWGDYWGSCQDRFGIRWMVNVSQAQG